jgi:hypothetical protein
MKSEFDGFYTNTQILNFTKIILVRAELFHLDRQTDRHDEANSRSSQFGSRPESEDSSLKNEPST